MVAGAHCVNSDQTSSGRNQTAGANKRSQTCICLSLGSSQALRLF